jgi:mRNA interferase RelE/StbE
MSYTVLIERSAQKQLAKISSPYFEAISEKILLLENDPRPPGCKKLTGRESWYKGRRLSYYLQHI